MNALTLIVNVVHKAEMEYTKKLRHTLGRIPHIFFMRRIVICYATSSIATQTVAPTHTNFQGINFCFQYLNSHPHKTIFYPFIYYDGSNHIRLTWSGNQVEEYTTQTCLECHEGIDHARIINTRYSVSGIIITLRGVDLFWKVHIYPIIASDSTGGEIVCI